MRRILGLMLGGLVACSTSSSTTVDTCAPGEVNSCVHPSGCEAQSICLADRAEGRFSTIGEVVLDAHTGLAWELTPTPGVHLDVFLAGALCSALTIGTRSDWRLPTARELVLLFDPGFTNPALPTPFVGGSGYRWTSTAVSFSFGRYWLPNDDEGFAIHQGSQPGTIGARCVHDG